jgi:hypothetical protein
VRAPFAKVLGGFLALAAATPSLAQDAETKQLLRDESVLNDNCRGGSGDDTQTWQACGARDYVGFMLAQRGYCYGKEGQIGTEMEWHQCTSGSIKPAKPEFAQP